MNKPQLNLDSTTQLVTVEDSSPTISVIWDQAVQQAIIATAPGPAIAARAYAMMHTAIYDAWSAYEGTAISTNLGDDLQRPQSENTIRHKRKAMSYAAHEVLVDLFPEQQASFDQVMEDLGYDPNLVSQDPTTPAGIGYLSAQSLLEARHHDGANQLGDELNSDGTPYSDYTGYQPLNEPGKTLNIEHWTPELVLNSDAELIPQKFSTPHWGQVTPFALDTQDQFRPGLPEPFLLVDGEVNLQAKTITLADGRTLDICPKLVGSIINPEFIAQAEEIVEYSANLTDQQKLTAEFWEDGKVTSYPPGTWLTFGEYVSARDEHTLNQDAQLFLALGNGALDASIASWESKVAYDYTRPVAAVRASGELGLIGEYDQDLGGYAIEAYGGSGEGTQTILAKDFTTYMTTPPFAEYTSGHSAFSATSAEILRQFTGSDDFGAAVTFESGASRFEPGITPNDCLTLGWDTFSAAAESAGMSRLYGGIHFSDGNLHGGNLGREVGDAVFDQAQFYINGGEADYLSL